MAISYKKLWKLLIDRDLKKRYLETEGGISPSTIAKLNKNQSVTTGTLERICNLLDCRAEDIMEITPDEKD